MNILHKFKEDRTHVALLENHKNLSKEYKRKENESIEEICNHLERITKTKAYKDCILKTFENDPYFGFISMANMSIMIQALNDRYNNTTIAEDYYVEYEYILDYANHVFDFKDNVAKAILELYEQDKNDNSVSDATYYVLNMSCQMPRKNSPSPYIRVTYEDVVFGEGSYYDAYRVDKRFERAIRAVYQCYLDIKDELEELFERLIAEKQVEF